MQGRSPVALPGFTFADLDAVPDEGRRQELIAETDGAEPPTFRF